ncbi:MAG: hypothetical protein ABGF52_13615, partial [Candidatus Asgardarchaeum sp.]
MRVKVIPEFDVKTIIDETIGKDWKRFQANAFEMGKKLRRYMQTYINSHRHRSGGKGALAEAINFDYKLTTGSIFWGIGEVEELNARAKYWYVVNYGTYYGSSERFIPGKKKGGAPKFVPGRFGAGFGHPPNSSLKGKEIEIMNKKIISKAVIVFLWTVSICWVSGGTKACECPKSSDTKQPVEEKTNAVDTVLKQLNKKTSELMSYQAQIEYNFIQPLLESEKLQKGVFYYAKLGKESKLRLNFQTRKIEDEEEEKYAEQYI